MGNSKKKGGKRELLVAALLQLAFVAALVAEWFAGSACFSPQVVREMQPAQPLREGKTSTSVSGGVMWPVTSLPTMGVPANPNADLNLLVRHSYEENKELQVPINLSTRLGPGTDATGTEWINLQLGTGVFWKHATLSGRSPWRPLYDAWVFGIDGGIFARFSGWDDDWERYPVSPFLGFYARSIAESAKLTYIRTAGFLVGINVYLTEFPIRIDSDALGGQSAFEGFIGFHVGSDRCSHLQQFTMGLAMHRIYGGPKLIIGATFGSTGR